MWNLSVPKTIHFYWGGGNLLYMRYLSITSFMKYNPDWQVIFWYPQKPFKGRSWYTDMYPPKINEKVCKDYLPDVMDLPITKICVDFKSLGFYDDFAEVHKNDYIRISALSTYGGVWSDMDVIYFRSIENLKVNIPENKNKETYVCISGYGHSTGFNMATENSRFFDSLFKYLDREYRRNKYQCWGPDMWNKYFKTLESIPNAVNLDMDVVYAHNCDQVSELLNGAAPRFTDGSIGCHWYGGNERWPDFFNQTGGGIRNLPKSLIAKIIRDEI